MTTIKKLRGPRDRFRAMAIEKLVKQYGVTPQFVRLALLPEARLHELAEQGDKLSPKGYEIRAAYEPLYKKIKNAFKTV